ncbi:MAG: ABC transporter ATP-binding protein [Planctomycetota bacterium]
MAQENDREPGAPQRLPRKIDELPPLSAAVFRRFYKDHVRPQLRFALPMIGLTGITIGSGLPIPFVPMWVMRKAIPAKDTRLLLLLVLFSLGLVILGSASRIAQQYFQVRFRQGIAYSLRGEILGHVLSLPFSFFDREETGYIMSRVSGDVAQVETLFSQQLFQFLLSVGKFIGGAIILFLLNWKLALIASAFLPLFFVTILVFRRPVRNVSSDFMEAMGAYFKSLQEVFAGIGLLKALGRSRKEGDRILLRVKDLFGPERRAVLLNGISSASSSLVTSLGMAAVLGFGVYEIIHDRVDPAILVTFLLFLGYLYGPSQSLANFPIQIQPAIVAMRRMLAFLGIRPEPAGGIEPETVSGEFRFEGVTFSYGGGGPVLRDVGFAVRNGEKVGVAGATGAGKSTLLKLLMGFYEPQEGRITLDGIPVGDYAPRAYRKTVGFIPQDAFFFSDTVAGNLLWAAPQAGPEEIASALEKAEASAFVSNLPQGLETSIGEGGKMISGGEKQRLAAARALLTRPEILLMDEGTSDLDEATEVRLLDNLLAAFKGRTVILVSHRASVLRKMDRVITVLDGEVREGGTEVKKLGS